MTGDEVRNPSQGIQLHTIQQVLVVTGGYNSFSSIYLDSTEITREGDSRWTTVSSAVYFSATTLDNQIWAFGTKFKYLLFHGTFQAL